MHRHARALAGRIQARDNAGVVPQHLPGDCGRDAAHQVVARRVDRHQLGDRIHAQVGAGELGDVGQLGLEHFLAQVADVDVDVVLERSGAASLQHFQHHRAGDDVAGR